MKVYLAIIAVAMVVGGSALALMHPHNVTTVSKMRVAIPQLDDNKVRVGGNLHQIPVPIPSTTIFPVPSGL